MLYMTRFTRYALALLLCGSASASAYTLTFNPNSQNVALGGKASVEIGISGVMPDGLGNYDFDVLFDPTILAFDQAIDQSGLGSAIGLGASPGADRVTLSDFSLEDPDVLLALQGDSFPLLTLVFNTLAVGSSSLDFDLVTLGDVNGASVTLAATGPGRISVDPAQIPEPGSLALLLGGLLSALVIRRNCNRG
jgi:hypothetical protein